MKKFLLIFLVIFFALPLPARAQEWLQFDELLIEIWPEYDRPSVLVIYRGVLSSNINLPAEVTFRIPASVGQPHAVAFRDEQGQLMTVQFERVVRGDLAEISFFSPSREIQFEYYDPTLRKEGQTRTYQYRWLDDHLVSSAAVQVQRPRGAGEFSVQPTPETAFEGNDGLMYFYQELSSLESGSFTLQISYQNESDLLSAAESTIQPSAPIDPGISLSFRGRDLIPWVVGGVGLLAFFSAVLLYWSYQRGLQAPDLRKALHLAGEPEQRESFCPKCGSETGENDLFCRICGAKLD